MNSRLSQLISIVVLVGSFVVRWSGKLTNYWLIEPAFNVAQRILWSVRYVVMSGAVVMTIYGYMNPESAVSIIKSLIPKVSVSISAPEILK
jgi:hypothetical protein